MKFKALQQRLIRISVIAAVIVAVLGAGLYALQSWSESLAIEHRQIQSRLSATRSDIATRESKAMDAEKYMGLYKTLISSSEQDKLADLNRDKAQDWISEAASELQLSELNGAFDPVVNIDGANFKKKTLQGVTSKVTLTFSALTDEQLYRFLEAVIVDFPGYVKVNKVVLEKKGDINDAILIAAGRGKFVPLVSGQLEFNWIAMKKNAPESSSSEEPAEEVYE